MEPPHNTPDVLTNVFARHNTQNIVIVNINSICKPALDNVLHKLFHESGYSPFIRDLFHAEHSSKVGGYHLLLVFAEKNLTKGVKLYLFNKFDP